ncbi:response regulator transcription factor [Anditalea andensis]|uniref:Transcriptional regulator n=1 Tax=Anditalea andensis TaxID=1048983 RepID=A0A074L0F0_9BACT|nr:response regulator transcription factor [Anditalea andensis]KEO73965.1 transcriptional regulator [Anditalea andensis]
MKNILVIEDDLMIATMVKMRLNKDGYNITVIDDGTAGIAAIENSTPDLIITDIVMSSKSGLEIITYAQEHQPGCPIIVLSSLSEEELTLIEAFNLGVSDFVPKPFHPNELSLRVKSLFKN